MTDKQKAVYEEKDKIVNQCLETMAAHFDAVIIFSTYHDKDNTYSMHAGSGNKNTHHGQVSKWFDDEIKDYPKYKVLPDEKKIK